MQLETFTLFRSYHRTSILQWYITSRSKKDGFYCKMQVTFQKICLKWKDTTVLTFTKKILCRPVPFVTFSWTVSYRLVTDLTTQQQRFTSMIARLSILLHLGLFNSEIWKIAGNSYKIMKTGNNSHSLGSEKIRLQPKKTRLRCSRPAHSSKPFSIRSMQKIRTSATQAKKYSLLLFLTNQNDVYHTKRFVSEWNFSEISPKILPTNL